MALRTGGTLEVDGESFNTGRATVAQPVATVAQAPAPAPAAPAAAPVTAESVAQLASALATIGGAIQAIAQAVPKPPAPEPEPEPESPLAERAEQLAGPPRHAYEILPSRDAKSRIERSVVLRDGVPCYIATTTFDPKTGLVDRVSITPTGSDEEPTPY